MLQEALQEVAPAADLTSGNPAMQRILTMARRVAESDVQS